MGRMGDLLDWIEGSMIDGEIQEIEEATSDVKEYLDPNKTDLLSVYQELNRLLFDGKLGIYPMKWNRRKRSGALVKYQRVKSFTDGAIPVRSKDDIDRVFNSPSVLGKPSTKYELKILSVEVSTHMAFTMKALKNRLAHEMIHVYWLENGVEYGHDVHFKLMMRRINGMNKGITVTVEESYQDPELAHKGKGKVRAVFIAKNGRIAVGITVTAEKNIEDMADAIMFAYPRYRLPDDRYWEIYLSDSRWLDEYPLARVPKGQKLPLYGTIRPLRLKEIIDGGVHYGSINDKLQLVKKRR